MGFFILSKNSGYDRFTERCPYVSLKNPAMQDRPEVHVGVGSGGEV
jgi:hypothetical protein